MRSRLETKFAFVQYFVVAFLILSPGLISGQCISSFPDRQGFEASAGNWTTGGTSSDWTWGQPAKSIIKSAGGGIKCWIAGGLSNPGYNDNESSWVKSPCYNFTNLKYPTIGVRVYWESEFNVDGTVLQYSTDNGITWVNTGSYTDPKNCLNMNWYNTAGIPSLGNSEGWSGSSAPGGSGCSTGNGSNGWLLASKTIPALAGKPNVQFRFLFGSSSGCNAYNGFAFDDFTVGEALPNIASFIFSCTSSNTVKFTNASFLCPTLNWDFGDPASGAANTSNAATPSHTFTGPGQYTVTLMATGPDNAPSTIKKTITILGLNTQVNTEPICNGDKNGSVSVTAIPAIAGLNYSWNSVPVQNASSAVNLGAGSFIVTVSGTNICTATGTITLNEPPVLKNIVSAVQPTCKNNDGSISLASSGGIAPYTYTWSPTISSSNLASGLPAGAYSILVKDKNLCQQTANITLTAPPPISASITAVKNVSCNGFSDGSATVSVSGAPGPYTFSWLPSGGNNATATGLTKNNYTVTVTDNNNCISTATAIINEPPVLKNIVSAVQPTCKNNDGSITLTSSGGTAPYTYTWTPAVSSSNLASGLPAGAYSILVKDRNLCQQTENITLTAPPAISASITAVKNVSCYGFSDGSATVSVSGAPGPYTFSWLPFGGNNATATGLTKNNYTVTVTDNNNCISTATAIINEPPVLKNIVSAVQPTCKNNDGSISLASSGGTAPYTYTWTPAVSSSNLASGLPAGAYSILVKDRNLCQQTANITLTAPPPISASITAVKNVSCYGFSDGSATVSVSGAPGPYTFSWLPSGGNNATATGLAKNNYTVTVTDNNNCVSTATAIINEPPVLKAIISSADATCGNNNGTASAVLSGGTAPYTYLWIPTNGATADISGLSPQVYNVNITDKNGCKLNQPVTINSAGTTLGISIGQTDVTCYGDATGKATATVTGGQAPYLISWSSGSTGPSVSGLKKGTYTVTAKDALGCSKTATVNILEPAAALSVNLEPVDALCDKGNGTVSSIVTGGTPGYTYAWSNSAASSQIILVPPGSYALDVTDKNGCKATATAAVKAPTPLSISMTVNPATCGFNNGSAIAAASGGTSPYSYAWSPGNYATPTITNLAPGNYDLTVTDKNGCVQNAPANISGSTAPGLKISKTDVSCPGGNTGSATVTISGGQAPFSITWSNGAAGATAINLKKGNYTVNVKDANGCTNSIQVSILESSSSLAISLTPTHPLCNNANGNVASNVSGGTAPYSYTWSNGATTQNLVSVPAGSYSLEVADLNGCKALAGTLIMDAKLIDIQFGAVQAATCGTSNGFIKSSVAGGTTPYSYLWSPGGETTNDLFNLSPGNYTLAITDKNGCTTSKDAIVPATGNFTVKSESTPIVCKGDKNGTAAVTISGGSAPYSTVWSTGETTTSVKDLAAGNYSVTVKDASGCSIGAIVSISVPPALSVSLEAQAATCSGNTGGITSIVQGNEPFSYNWQPGNLSAPNLSNLPAGNYSLTVTDKNGCNKTASIVVPAANPFSISLGKDTVICGTNGFDLSPGIFESYTWQNGSGAPVFRVTSEGNYWVTVKDRQGCLATDSIKVVSDCGEIWFPTAFTPNGDGKNEEFGPLGNLALVSNYSMTIFDRWGMKVFESYNPAIKWNGNYRGNAPGGNYAWFARYKRSGIVEMKKGNLVLVR